MIIYNLEYRVLDKLKRTKKTFHGGLFLDEVKLDEAKKQIIESIKEKNVAFDVYVIEQKSPLLF